MRRMLMLAVAAALTCSATLMPLAPAAEMTAPSRGERVLTLVTGDGVTVRRVAGLDVATAVPGPGRGAVRFAIRRTGQSLYVVPDDAAPLVAAGRLDRRLFDVRTLLEFGYDDARTGSLPLIVSYRDRVPAGLSGATVRDRLRVVGALALRQDKSDATSFWKAATRTGDVRRIWLDGLRRPTLDGTAVQVGAPAAWQAGHTGTGVTVAVLDTGVDASHPDLAGRVAEQQNFTEDPGPSDTIGHGTHVAATIAGGNARYRGIAPGAGLISGKVCAAFGCPESAIIAGMAWAAPRARIVNLSLGGPDQPELDPVEEAVGRLTAAHGTLFVVAAGNSGQAGSHTVSSPGSADAALTVGAVDRDDALAAFSGRGPRIGDEAIKPDITAPGVDVVAARAAGSTIGEPVGDHHLRLSGTSMATPHVAGAAAILAGAHPDWTAATLKAVLTGTARPTAGQSVDQQGAGRLDIARADGQTLLADTPSLSLGTQSWPHNDDEPVRRTVGYSNTGATPVAVTLGFEMTAPDGMFTVSPSTIDVPPGERRTVTVTVDTRVGGRDGRYTGRLLATAGEQTLGVPVAIVKEVESHWLTVRHVDHDGVATGDYRTAIHGIDLPAPCPADGCLPGDPGGTASVRLPKGSYAVATQIATSVLIQPLLELDRDTTLVLDARQAGPVDIGVPRSSARIAHLQVVYQRRIDYPSLAPASGFHAFSADPATGAAPPVYAATVGPAVPAGDLTIGIAAGIAEPGPDRDFFDSPYVYHLAWQLPGELLPNGFAARIRHQDLAEVRSSYHTAVPGKYLYRSTNAIASDSFFFLGATMDISCRLPCSRTEYYSTGPRFTTETHQLAARHDRHGENQQDIYLVSYPRPGRYSDTFNGAVFGPSFPDHPNTEELWVTRSGDRITIALPMFGGQGPNRTGSADRTTGRTVLYRDGQKIAEWPYVPWGARADVDVPPGEARYRLEVRADHSAVSPLSTKVDASWSFRSGRTSADRWHRLPVSAIRFAPALDEYDRAPAGRRFRMPIEVQSQQGPVAVRSLTLEVSYDDGTTWRPQRVHRDRRHGWIAFVDHPAGAGHVSLRTGSTDAGGNTVDQTIIRAYAIRG